MIDYGNGANAVARDQVIRRANSTIDKHNGLAIDDNKLIDQPNRWKEQVDHVAVLCTYNRPATEQRNRPV